MEIINTTVVWPMVGDNTPQTWCDIVLGFHEKEGDLLSYKYLDVDGLNVTFSFKHEVPSTITVAEMIVSVYDLVEYMIGEKDFTIKDVAILSPDRDESFSVHHDGKSVA